MSNKESLNDDVLRMLSQATTDESAEDAKMTCSDLIDVIKMFRDAIE